MILMNDVQRVLAAEVCWQDARPLLRGLELLGYQVGLAMTAKDVLKLLREDMFRSAVVAAEMALKGEALLGRLSRLPTIERLVAIGPPGNGVLELTARRAGAAYLTRPVSVDALAAVLRRRTAAVAAGS